MSSNSNPNLSVRISEAKDAETIATFTRNIALETEDISLDPEIVQKGVAAVFDNPNLGFYVVAVQHNEVVGCLMITYEWSDWRNGVQWWLQSVYVKSEFRRMGVFKRLYQFIVDLASQKVEVCGIRLYVDQSNEKALQTYQSLGLDQTEYLVYETALHHRQGRSG